MHFWAQVSVRQLHRISVLQTTIRLGIGEKLLPLPAFFPKVHVKPASPVIGNERLHGDAYNGNVAGWLSQKRNGIVFILAAAAAAVAILRAACARARARATFPR